MKTIRHILISGVLSQILVRVIPMIALSTLQQPAAAQPPFTLTSFSGTYFPGFPAPVADLTFTSSAPLVQVIIFLRGPDNFLHQYNIPPNPGNIGPNLWRAFGPGLGMPLINGFYKMERINALNSLNQNFNIAIPLNVVPDFSFTVVNPVPFAFTAYSQTPFQFSGANSVRATLNFSFSTSSALSTSCRVNIAGPGSTTLQLPLSSLTFDGAGQTATARTFLDLNDPARPNGTSYVVTSLECTNSAAQSLNVAAANFPGGSPAPLFDLPHCAPPVAPPGSTGVDLTAPLLTCLALSPAAINTTLVDSVVQIPLGATDENSGLDSASVTLTSPLAIAYNGFTSFNSPGQRSGNALSSITIPRYAPAGSYALSVTLKDLAGNSRTYSGQDLATLGFPATLAVSSSDPDSTPPTLTSIAFLPNTVDTTSQDVTYNIDVGFQDAKSGLSGASIILPYNDGLLAFRYEPSLNPGNYVSGNANGGIFRTQVTLRRHFPAGVYTPSSITLTDRVGNSSTTTPVSPPVFTVNSASSDTGRPKVVFFDFTPKAINTASAAVVVSYTSRWTDDRSGFPPSALPDVTLQSPSGKLVRGPGTCTLLSSGDIFTVYPRNVLYQCTVTIPKLAEPGIWTVTRLGMNDAVTFGPGPFGRGLNTGEVAAMGFPTQLFNAQSSATSDGILGPQGGTVISQSNPLLSLSAPAGVLGLSTSISMFASINPGSLPVPQGFSGAVTNVVTYDLTPLPNGVFPAPGLTITIPTLSTLPLNAALVLFRLDPVSGALTPAPSVFGGSATGVVASGGNQVTFTGIGMLTNFVAFRRNSEVLGDVDGDGVVTCTDVAIIRAALGRRAGQPGFDARADLNRDGVIDVRDLASVIRQLAPGVACP